MLTSFLRTLQCYQFAKNHTYRHYTRYKGTTVAVMWLLTQNLFQLPYLNMSFLQKQVSYHSLRSLLSVFCLSTVCFVPKTLTFKLLCCSKTNNNKQSLAPHSSEREIQIWTCIFKSGSLLNWQILVKFRSMNSKDGILKKKEPKQNMMVLCRHRQP